jgi:hypothetical protein
MASWPAVYPNPRERSPFSRIRIRSPLWQAPGSPDRALARGDQGHPSLSRGPYYAAAPQPHTSARDRR